MKTIKPELFEDAVTATVEIVAVGAMKQTKESDIRKQAEWIKSHFQLDVSPEVFEKVIANVKSKLDLKRAINKAWNECPFNVHCVNRRVMEQEYENMRCKVCNKLPGQCLCED